MPIKVYPSVNERVYVTSQRKTFSGACVASGAGSVAESIQSLRSINITSAVGWTIPGFRRLRNSGAILPFTPWEKFSLSGSAQLAAREWCGSPTGTRNRWDNLYNGGTFLDTSSGSLMTKVDAFDLSYLVQKAAAGIAAGGFDALTFLAEVNQLRRMFSGIVTKLDRLRGGRHPGELQDLWLEGRYGWRTLLFDIQDFSEALSSANDRRTRYRKAAGLSVNGSWNAYSESTSSGMKSGDSSDISWTGNLKGTVVADIEVPGFRYNPVTTAWEVTRLSFVVDWLWNVGQALDAATFLLMAKDYKAGVGYRFDFNLSWSRAHLGTTGTTQCFGNTGSASGTASVIRRSSTTVSAIPRVKLRMDGWKALDLLSLVLQRFKFQLKRR
jgi:hypothetical protein